MCGGGRRGVCVVINDSWDLRCDLASSLKQSHPFGPPRSERGAVPTHQYSGEGKAALLRHYG